MVPIESGRGPSNHIDYEDRKALIEHPLIGCRWKAPPIDKSDTKVLANTFVQLFRDCSFD
jgi:hypothetical protein